MKKILYLIFKTSPEGFKALEEIKKEGFNATIMSTESLRHVIDDLPEDKHFFTLRHVEKVNALESVTCLFIVDEEKLEALKSLVRKNTDDFKKIKGFMFSLSLNDYEGSI